MVTVPATTARLNTGPANVTLDPGIARGTAFDIGSGMFKLAATASAFVEKQRAAAEAIETTRATAAATREVHDLAFDIENSKDWRGGYERFIDGASGIMARATKSASSETGQARIEAHVSNLIESQRIALRSKLVAAQVDEGKADLTGFIDEQVRAFAAAPGEVVREKIREGVASQLRSLADTGVLSKREEATTWRAFKAKTLEGDARADILADPATAARLLADPSGPYAEIDPVQRLALQRDAEGQAEKRQHDADRRLEEARQATLSDLTIGVKRGAKGYSDVENAYTAGVLKPHERTALTLALDEQGKAAAKDAERVRRVATAIGGGVPLDPKDADDRKAVDLHFAATAKAWQPGPDLPARVADYVEKTGIVPDPVRGRIRGSLRSGADDQKVAAADLLDRIATKSPQALEDFQREDIDLGMAIVANMKSGMPARPAVQLAQDAMKVDKATRDERREIQARDKHSQANIKWMQSEATGGWFSSLPGKIPDAMQGEFDKLYAQRFTATGNIEASQKSTLADLKRVWGVTKADGQGARWMKYAPEAVYAVPGVDPSWMREQLDAEMPGQKGKLMIAADDRTAREPQPSYALLKKNDAGAFEPVTNDKGQPLRWRPDFRSSSAYKRIAEEASKQADDALTTARRERQQRIDAPTADPATTMPTLY